MTPEAALSTAPTHSGLSAVSPALTRETLLKLFAEELQKLEPLCLTPPKLEQQSLLHFRCEEFAEVNETWKNGGIAAVLAKWGAERTFAQGKTDTLGRHSSPPTSDGQYPLILAIHDFVPDTSPNPVQINYYRSRNFELSGPCKYEIRATLESSGILNRFAPRTDTVTHASLSEAPIEDINCSCQWYGPENLYGDGVMLQMALTLRPAGEEPVLLRLSVDKRGVMTRSLWAEDLMETGYEGHDHISHTLLAEELRALLPIIARLNSETPAPPLRHTMGTWIANSFLPVA